MLNIKHFQCNSKNPLIFVHCSSAYPASVFYQGKYI